MPDQNDAKNSAMRAQAIIGHPVSYYSGGSVGSVNVDSPKQPEINENKWMDDNSSQEKIISPSSNSQMPIYKSQFK